MATLTNEGYADGIAYLVARLRSIIPTLEVFPLQ